MADNKPTGTCQSCGNAGMLRTATLECESCGKTMGIKACDACMGKGGNMVKMGGRKCKACGGALRFKACRTSSVPTSYDMLKRAMREETKRHKTPHALKKKRGGNRREP